MKATSPGPEIVTRQGRPVSVIIPIKDYEGLLQRVEEANDAAWIKRARKPPLQYRPVEEYLADPSDREHASMKDWHGGWLRPGGL